MTCVKLNKERLAPHLRADTRRMGTWALPHSQGNRAYCGTFFERDVAEPTACMKKPARNVCLGNIPRVRATPEMRGVRTCERVAPNSQPRPAFASCRSEEFVRTCTSVTAKR